MVRLPWQREKKDAPPKPKELVQIHKRLDAVEGRITYIEKSLDVFKAGE